MTAATPAAPAPRRSPAVLAALGLAALAVFAGLVALGTWQVHRLVWKRDLIARVDRRVAAAPLAPPGPAAWPSLTRETDDYRHVVVHGTYVAAREADVQAVTTFGGGFWVLSPLRTDEGFTVLINRGFVPPERRGASPAPVGAATVTGLLRMSEPGGAFLRGNDPVADRWYSRDLDAIAAARAIGPVAPYFIDAEAAAAGFPVGGLTVVSFPDNHLVYALTWYALAAMLAATSLWVIRDERRYRRDGPQP